MITPFDSISHGPSITSVPTNRPQYPRLKAWISKITDAWFAVQITHYGGKYSIERMLALEEYTRKTSLRRVLFVIIATPLPVITIVLCQESIPLQNPKEGWEVNYGFWIRFLILGIGEGYGTALQTCNILQDISLSRRQMWFVSAFVSIGIAIVAMVIAAYWVFPIPFINFTLSMALFSIFVGAFGFAIGGQAFKQILSQRKQLQQCSNFFSLQLLMVCIYPAFQMLFNAATHTRYELPVLMLLPVIKLVLKNILTFAIIEKEDTIPEQVILTVDFFDALYLAMFMQSITSTTAVVVIISSDFFQTVLDLYDLNQRTRSLFVRLRKAVPSIAADGDLLTAARLLCFQSKTLQSRLPAFTQRRSCIPHELSAEGKALLDKLGSSSRTEAPRNSIRLSRSIFHTAIPRTSSSLATIPSRTSQRKSTFGAGIPIQPDEPVAAENSTSATYCKQSVPGNDGSKHMKVDSSKILHDTLEALFTAECLVLTEFLETIIPFYYANFVIVMVQLPSSVYHRELSGVTPDNVGGIVQNVFIIALLELVSSVVHVIIMWRSCGIRALYQLALVLETQTSSVQSRLILLVIMTLTYCVVHFGVDFTFQIPWVKNHST